MKLVKSIIFGIGVSILIFCAVAMLFGLLVLVGTHPILGFGLIFLVIVTVFTIRYTTIVNKIERLS